MNIVVFEVSIVITTVAPVEFSFAMLLAVLVEAFVSGSVWPRLNTVALLFIFKPSACVTGVVQMSVLA